jgi:hypothetical protein
MTSRSVHGRSDRRGAAGVSSPKSHATPAQQGGWRSVFSPGAILILASFASAFLVNPPINLTWMYSCWLILVVSGGWAAAIALGWVPEGDGPDKRLLCAVAVVAAVATVAALFSADPADSILYASLSGMSLLIWFALLIGFVGASRLRFEASVRNGLVLASLAALYPLVAAAFQEITHSALTVFADADYFVSVMILFVPIGLGLARTSAARWAKAGWLAFAAAVAVVILFQGSLSGYVVVPVVLLGAIAMDPKSFLPTTVADRWLRRAASALAILIAASMVVGVLVAPEAVARWPHLTDGLKGSIASRVELWRGAEVMAARSPLVGVGPGMYAVSALRYLDSWKLPETATEGLYVTPESPHSLIWTVILEIGFIGLLACLALGILWALAWRRGDDSSEQARILRNSLGLAFAAYLICLLTTPASVIQGIFPAVVAGLAIASTSASHGPGAAQRRVRFVACIAFGVVAILAAASGVWSLNAYLSAPSKGIVEGGKVLEQVEALQPGNPLYRFHWYEYQFETSTSEQQASAARSALSREHGTIAQYAPGLVWLADLSATEAGRTGRTDFTWESQLLSEAQQKGGEFPSLLLAQLHVAAISGNRSALAAALAAAKQHAGFYPPLDSAAASVQQSSTPAAPK